MAQRFERWGWPDGRLSGSSLGLTTQVPSVVELAVCGRPPAPMSGVRFVSRAPAARSDLRPTEVAVLEVLRAWLRYSERSWPEFVEAVAMLAERGAVSLSKIHEAAMGEYHRQPRTRAAQLATDLADRDNC